MCARDEDRKCLVGEGTRDRGRGEALAAALMARVPPASGVYAGARCGVRGCSLVFIVSTFYLALLLECVCRKIPLQSAKITITNIYTKTVIALSTHCNDSDMELYTCFLNYSRTAEYRDSGKC